MFRLFGAIMEGEHPLTVVEVAVGPSHARSRESVQEELRAAYAADQQAREEGEDVDETQPPSPGKSKSNVKRNLLKDPLENNVSITIIHVNETHLLL